MSNYDKNNIFAKIIREEIPCDKIYEDKNIIAFEDINKVAPIHILVIPKDPYISFADFTSRADPSYVSDFFSKIAKIAKNLGLEDGYRLITNNGSDAGQTIFHFHVHIIGKKKLTRLI